MSCPNCGLPKWNGTKPPAFCNEEPYCHCTKISPQTPADKRPREFELLAKFAAGEILTGVDRALKRGVVALLLAYEQVVKERDEARARVAKYSASLKYERDKNKDLHAAWQAAQVDAQQERAKSAKLVEAIRASITRSDDYGDSHCSRPIRDALAEYAEDTPTESSKADKLLKRIRDFLDEDIAKLECYASVWTLPDDEWGILMHFRDEIDLYFTIESKKE